MSEKWIARGRDAAEAFKQGAENSAHEIHRISDALARHDGKIADETQALTQALGGSFDTGGKALESTGQQASQSLHGNASRVADGVRDAITGQGATDPGIWLKAAGGLGWLTTKIVVHAGGFVADAVTVFGKAAVVAGRYTEHAAPALGGVIGGIVRGAATVTSNAVDAAVLPASTIDEMRAQLCTLGQVERKRSEIQMRAIKAAQMAGRRDELLDLLIVGGMTLAQALRNPSAIPAAIEKAFHLAYPGLPSTETFQDAVGRMSGDQLVGLASGVKGKLFELELLDHLNSGGLPDGFHAELAQSATQPGWDIEVLDEHGHVSDLLQAKATESVAYVKEALTRYPDIDVTSTTEVHAQLVALGLAEHVHNSGISEAVLQAKLDAAIHAGHTLDASGLMPSTVGLAVIAMSVFMNKETNLREKGLAMGDRSTKASVTGVVGKAAMIVTHTWWIGLIAGVGSRWLVGHGGNKREQYEALKAALGVMQRRPAIRMPA